MTGAGGLRRVSENAIRDFRLPIADLETQKTIADFLDQEIAVVTGLIQKREAFLSLLEEKKAALAAKAVNGSILGAVTEG